MPELVTPVPGISPARQKPHQPLDEVRRAHDEGRYLDAFLRAEQTAPLREWTGVEPLLLAGRVAGQVGGLRLARWLFLRAFRLDTTHPAARSDHASSVLRQRGPLPCLEFMRQHGDLDGATPRQQSDWFLTRANALGQLRDFDSAELWVARAEQLQPDNPWIWVERANLLDMEDLLPEALTTLQKCLAQRPLYRPAVQVAAHVLCQLGRDDEALDLLGRSTQALQSAGLYTQQALLQQELERYDEARDSLQKALSLAPLTEAKGFQWFAQQLAKLEVLRGDRPRAGELYTLGGQPALAARMASVDHPHRAVLNVPFVRQHHMTCVPATLTSIAQFWRRPADHLALANELCYGGTTARSERAWAEANGWVVREFRLDWDTAVALIDRGVPFTLTTTEAESAHLQAVAGYDTGLKALILRDPSVRSLVEVDAEMLLEEYGWSGPRGVALVPHSHASLLEGLHFPDREHYDALYAVEQALHVHDRTLAGTLTEQLLETAPGHRLALDAARAIATYDDDPHARLSNAAARLGAYPHVPALVLWHLSCLKDLARHDEREKVLRAACTRSPVAPVYWRVLAESLSGNAKDAPYAARLLKRYMRYQPTQAMPYQILADIWWQTGQKKRALPLYRFATCLNDRDERHASSYFLATHALGNVEEGLRFLEEREERFGDRSAKPYQTLSWAYQRLDRGPDALDLAHRALTRRPQDGELQLCVAQDFLAAGNLDEAAHWIAQAQSSVKKAAYLRAAANLERARFQWEKALAHWQTLLATEPLALDAHKAIAELLLDMRGRDDALAHLRAAHQRFPHHRPLHVLFYTWVRTHDRDAAVDVVRSLAQLHPTDAWVFREGAYVLAQERQFEEASQMLERARVLEPEHPSFFGVAAALAHMAGDIPRAIAAHRESIHRTVDGNPSVSALLALGAHTGQAAEAIAFIEAELRRQVLTRGEGLLDYLKIAPRARTPEDISAFLDEALAQRPDLWMTWAASIRYAVARNQCHAARALALEATARFPLVPALWVDRSKVHGLLQDTADERSALIEALRINPAWGEAARRLAQAYRALGDNTEAIQVLLRAVQASPNDPENHGALAQALWESSRAEEALHTLQIALRLEPSSMGAWDALLQWSTELGTPERAIRFARTLSTEQAGQPHVHCALARVLTGPETLDERLHALDRALVLRPRMSEAHNMRAVTLAEAGRFAEAERALLPAVYPEGRPVELIARHAWLKAQQQDAAGTYELAQEALARRPNYGWALALAIDAAHALGRHAEGLALATQLVQLEPHSARSHGYWGDSLRQNGKKSEAIAAFREAVQREPAYTYAGWALVQLLLDTGALDDARQALEQLAPYVPRAERFAVQVELECQAQQRVLAYEAFEALCLEQSLDAASFEKAIRALVQAGFLSEARAVLADAVRRPGVMPGVGSAWAKLHAPALPFREMWRRLQALASMSTGPHALAAYLEWLGERKQHALAALFILAHYRLLRRLHLTWGMVGDIATRFGWYRFGLHWMADFRLRAVDAGMLLNVAVLAHAEGNRTMAAQARTAALTLSTGPLARLHRVWSAYDRALMGEPNPLQDGAGKSEPLPDFYEFLQTLTQLLHQARPAGVRLSETEFEQVKAAMHQLFEEQVRPHARDLLWRSVYLETLGHLRRQRRGANATWWWLRHRAKALWPSRSRA